MQRIGVPRNFVNCLFTALQEAVHKVRTGFGDSKDHYGGKVWLVPIHGIGQGNGAGPAIWAVVSTPLLNVLREKGFGCEIVCPLSSKYYSFVGYAFVDDTDLIQSQLQEDPEQARDNLQEAIHAWEFSLKATCGALVPEKTAWWLVSFQWSGSSWSSVSIQVSYIIFHTFYTTLTGKLYKTSLELFHIELGLNPQRNLVDPSIIDDLTTPSLVKSTMIFMSIHQFYIKHPITMPRLRQQNEIIMESLLRLQIPLNDFIACNQCWLYLKVCVLSKIVTGDGAYILE
jgi:hypothetical protein